MAEMSRDEVLARYRHLRAISTRHHTEAMNFFSRPALLEQARHLGLAAGGMLAAESFDELTLAFDLAIHAARPGHSRAVDRYAGAAAVPAGLGRGPGAGGDAPGALLALAGGAPARGGRAGRPGPATGGRGLAGRRGAGAERARGHGGGHAAVHARRLRHDVRRHRAGRPRAARGGPRQVLPRVRGTPDRVADDRRFATAIYRAAVARGLMARVGFEAAPPPAR